MLPLLPLNRLSLPLHHRPSCDSQWTVPSSTQRYIALLPLLILSLLKLTTRPAGAVLVRVADNEALLHGGADPASAQLFSDVWVLNVESASWTQLEANGLIARHALQGLALPNGSVLFIGGSTADGATWQPQLLQRSGVVCTVTDVSTARCNSLAHFPQALVPCSPKVFHLLLPNQPLGCASP